MNTLSFETGLQEFRLNEKCTVRFNPTDTNFIARIYDAFDALDKKQDDYRRRLDETEDPAELISMMKERDVEMREIIDKVFDSPICEPLFGSVSVFSMAGGSPIWANLFFAIIDVIDADIDTQTKMKNPKIEKYVRKYAKK